MLNMHLRWPLPIRSEDEWLSQNAAEFCAALDVYAEHAACKKKAH
jgi:hypothetical protein